MKQKIEWILRRKVVDGNEYFYPICELSKQYVNKIGRKFLTRDEKEFLSGKRIKFKVSFTDAEFRKIANEWVKYD